MRREDLEAQRTAARKERDAANKEVRALRLRVAPVIRGIGAALVDAGSGKRDHDGR